MTDREDLRAVLVVEWLKTHPQYSGKAMGALADAVIAAGWRPPVPSCGFDVGDPPDSCRCVLPSGHAGFHRCRHYGEEVK